MTKSFADFRERLLLAPLRDAIDDEFKANEWLRAQHRRRAIETDLRQALLRGEFELHYQALNDVTTRRAIGFEALLRWHHPVRGLIPPIEFIPIAEESGMIVPIGEWVLREALAEAARWPNELRIAVNVSAAQMHGDALLGQVVAALAASGVGAHRLELEITETVLLDDREAQRHLLHRLRELGVRIALDDFGTGFSSLNYLRSFPFDKLKVDRGFVEDIASDADSRAIVETVLALARRFRMETIAEGVESEEQLAALAAMGCGQVQGFLFGKPVRADDLAIERAAPRAEPVPRGRFATLGTPAFERAMIALNRYPRDASG